MGVGWSATLTVSTLCSFPTALILFTGAPRLLYDALQPTSDASQLDRAALVGAHLLALAMLIVAVSGYVRWARRASLRSQKDRMVRVDASYAGHSRSWKAAAAGDAEVQHGGMGTLSPTSNIVHRRPRAAVPLPAVPGARAFVDEQVTHHARNHLALA